VYKETKRRSFLKTLSWRITATLTTMLLVWLFTGGIQTALAVGGIEFFAEIDICL